MNLNKFNCLVFFFLLLNLYCTGIFCQTASESFFNTVKKTVNDTVKVNTLDSLCRIYIIKDAGKAIEYGKEALSVSEKINFAEGVARCYGHLGIAYSYNGNYREAIKHTLKALGLNRLSGNKLRLAGCYNNLGIIFQEKGNVYYAAKCYFKALAISESIGNKEAVIRNYCNLGNVYTQLKSFSIALKYYDKSFKSCIKNNYKEPMVAILIGKGNVYFDMNNDSLALKYYQEALKYNSGTLNQSIITACYVSIGNIFTHQSKYSSALECYQKALANYQNYNAPKNESICLFNIAFVYDNMGKDENAIKYSLKSIEIAQEIGALETIMDNAKILAENYSRTGNCQNGFKYYKIYAEAKDSIYNITMNKQIIEMEAKYQNEKKEKEIIAKSNKIELLEQRDIVSKYKRWGLIAGIFIVVFISLVFINYQKRKIVLNNQVYIAKNKLIESELNNEKLKSKQLQTEKLLSEAELDNERLKSSQLQKELEFRGKELDFKNKEIVNYALHIVEKNEFINNLRTIIENSKNEISPEQIIRVINQNATNTEKERIEFESNIESASHSFFVALSVKIPGITSNEKRLAALLRLNLSSKEIASVLNISSQTVDTYRYNLRRKLNLGKDDNLSEYLNNI